MIVASPYLPTVYKYSDSFSTIRYDKFVELAGCGKPANHSSSFDCLVATDAEVLQNASGLVSTTLGYFGSFAFLPVIDDDYILERPAVQLSQGKIAGKRLLIGVSHSPFVNPEIETHIT
jgi:hypothetical protein